MKLNPKFWKKATDARAELEKQLNDRSDVCFVDIGYPLDDDASAKEISLRIHTCKDPSPMEHKTFPKTVDGFPVVVSNRRHPSKQQPT